MHSKDVKHVSILSFYTAMIMGGTHSIGRIPVPPDVFVVVVTAQWPLQRQIKRRTIEEGITGHIYLLGLLQLPLVEVGNAMRAYCYSTASCPYTL